MNRPGSARLLRVESLESRTLLTASVSPAGVLTITGTDRSDKIEVKLENSQLQVFVNRAKDVFDAAAVQQIDIFGLKGNDSIQVSGQVSVNTYIDGGAGNDHIQGGGGIDEIHGGGGNDQIDGGDGNDAVFGDAGNDRLKGGAGADEIHGGAGNDQLIGDAGDDDLFGDAGNDKLEGDDGDDALHGGAGNDAVLGNLGDDDLFGDAGGDVLRGSAGDDDLFGGAGADKCFGGLGDDLLAGGDGRDMLDGQEGANLIDGGQGNDVEKNGDHVEIESELLAVLSDASSGLKAKAEFESETEDGATTNQLEIKAAGGTPADVLEVVVGGVSVGSITIDSEGRGSLVLSSHPEHDGELPLPDGLSVTEGTTIQIGTTLQGAFVTVQS